MLDALYYTFVEVAQAGSFNKAAERLFLSPTAVMKQIDRLERRCGFRLLERTSRGVLPTAAGASLLRDVQRLDRLGKAALERARQKQDHAKISIRVGTSPLYPCRTITELWDQSPELRNGFSLTIIPFEDSQDDRAHRLVGQAYDIMVGPFDADPARDFCGLIPFGNRRIEAYLLREHPLSCKSLIKPADFDGSTLRMLPRGISPVNDAARDSILAACGQVEILDGPPYYDTALFNACAQDGIPLLALDGWSDVHPLLVSRPIDVPGGVPYGIIHEQNPVAGVASFLDAVSTALETAQ